MRKCMTKIGHCDVYGGMKMALTFFVLENVFVSFDDEKTLVAVVVSAIQSYRHSSNYECTNWENKALAIIRRRIYFDRLQHLT